MAVDFQVVTQTRDGLPSNSRIEGWVEATLKAIQHEVHDVSVRVVDEAEITQLNLKFRGKNEPTNVLSFPFEKIEGVDYAYLGDMVICLSVVKKESKQKLISETYHFAHMVIHGTLHLCGYDHQEDDEAKKMETLEQSILGGIMR